MKVEHRIQVSGFPNYEVDNMGNVFSKNYKLMGVTSVLKQGSDKDGYACVVLSKNGKTFPKKVHRLVAETFLPKVTGKEVINHKNSIRNDNRVENLEWCTIKENVNHGWKMGRKFPESRREQLRKTSAGIGNPKAKLNEVQVLEMRRMRLEGSTYQKIADSFNMSVSQTQSVCKMQSWAHV